MPVSSCIIKISMVIHSTFVYTWIYIGDQGDKIIHTNNPTKYSGTICAWNDHKEIYWEFNCDFTLSSPSTALTAFYLYALYSKEYIV